MRLLFQVAILTSSLFVFGKAYSVQYTLPGPGWQQLQDANYLTVCQTGQSEVCDVSPGSYTLLDFSSSPPQRTLVDIPSSTQPYQCESQDLEAPPVSVLYPPNEGVTVYYAHYSNTGQFVASFGLKYIGVLGWETIQGADGYDIYMNGEYHGTSNGNNDNGGYSFVIDPTELPQVTFPHCPRCVDTLRAQSFRSVRWNVVAWNSERIYSEPSRDADYQFAPDHPSVLRLLPVIEGAFFSKKTY